MTQTPTPQLPERYQLAEVVGTGATSRVYRAIDTVLDAPRAVKILKTGNDPNFAERLLREARAMARVAHPNILQVYDAGMLRDGRAWVVTDLAHGSLAASPATVPCPSSAPSPWPIRCSLPCRPRTTPASSIATSSQRTCC